MTALLRSQSARRRLAQMQAELRRFPSTSAEWGYEGKNNHACAQERRLPARRCAMNILNSLERENDRVEACSVELKRGGSILHVAFDAEVERLLALVVRMLGGRRCQLTRSGPRRSPAASSAGRQIEWLKSHGRSQTTSGGTTSRFDQGWNNRCSQGRDLRLASLRLQPVRHRVRHRVLRHDDWGQGLEVVSGVQASKPSGMLFGPGISVRRAVA
jgi:hypothetical protein